MVTAPSPTARAVRAIAIARNPDSRKTALFFNALTGLRQKVGNYPGVTVEKIGQLAGAHGEPFGAALSSEDEFRSRPARPTRPLRAT